MKNKIYILAVVISLLMSCGGKQNQSETQAIEEQPSTEIPVVEMPVEEEIPVDSTNQVDN